MRSELVLLLVLALSPLGCENAGADRPGLGVVAKVNGAEISAHQPTSAQALEKVIDRELLVQQALHAGLDRDPAVMELIDHARRQLLAQAWLERKANPAKPAADEVLAFYAENPALFGKRRVYRLRELVVSAPEELIGVLRAEAAKAKDLDELAAWLKSRNARFSAASTTQPAEQLPLAFLPELARMNEGEIAVFAAPPAGASVVQLVYAEHAPLTEQQAAPVIEKLLAGRKRLEIAAAEIKRLRETASIEYLAEFKREKTERKR
jgi:EpsD family peptidyl-prolyl cis-trans isomerase